MPRILITTLFVLMCLKATAQFGSSGIITFKRVENTHMMYKIEMSENNRNSSDMLKYFPKNKSSFFKLTFNKKGSYYAFEKDGDEKTPEFWGKQPASENTVWQDMERKTYHGIKELFGSTFEIVDSLPKYKWKIHDEMRQIAGYTCRKATTIILDTVVVVAYYTPQIMLSGGPESFNGLPGMILGLAVPRLYTSWFATEVRFEAAELPKVDLGKKPKELSNKKFQESIEERLKEWGSFGKSTLLRAAL